MRKPKTTRTPSRPTHRMRRQTPGPFRLTDLQGTLLRTLYAANAGDPSGNGASPLLARRDLAGIVGAISARAWYAAIDALVAQGLLLPQPQSRITPQAIHHMLDGLAGQAVCSRKPSAPAPPRLRLTPDGSLLAILLEVVDITRQRPTRQARRRLADLAQAGSRLLLTARVTSARQCPVRRRRHSSA